MSRPALHPASVCAALLLCASLGQSLDQSAGQTAGQTAAARNAVEAMRRGDFPAAEAILRAAVQARSGDSWAISLLGVALDNQKRIREADEFHIRAVALSPRSADILNNYGTHLWIAGQYDKAETVFSNALSAAPTYFLVLYNLGVMATYTGHYERAREALETALRQQPQNVDALYRLACVEEASKHWETAVMRLAQAAKLDPRRPDIQKLLAVTTTELGALDDAEAAWDRYLQLAPNDDAARRERGYSAARMGKFEQGIADLEWYAARHPDDPAGQYELGQAERTLDFTKALAHLDQALSLNPEYAAARAARGSLYYQEGKPESAVADLERAASLQPDDSANLDRLGQTYQALNRGDDAVRVLGKAAQLAPEDSTILLHFGRALADAGRVDESKAAMDRFRQLGPEKQKGVPAGLVDYLALTPEQRRADYRARVEKAVRERPDEPAAQLDYLKLTLEDGGVAQAGTSARRIAALKPDAAILAAAGRALLKFHQYALAKDLLKQAAATSAEAGITLDLAMATLHAAGGAAGAQAALELVNRIPESQRTSDGYLARAEILDAAGKPRDAVSALGQALRLASGRPEIYLRANAFLIGKENASEALRSIDEGAQALPENREIMLRKATTLEYAGKSAEARRLLNDIQSRWPEWSAVWLAQGCILDAHQHYDEARQALETAVALGAGPPEAYFFLADAALHSTPANIAAAETAIRQALKLSPNDPWIQSLAGRTAFARGEFQLAAARHEAAIRLRPRLVEAHDGLAQAYAALGRNQDADAERKQAAAIGQSASNPRDSSGDYPGLARLFDGSLLTPSRQ